MRIKHSWYISCNMWLQTIFSCNSCIQPHWGRSNATVGCVFFLYWNVRKYTSRSANWLNKSETVYFWLLLLSSQCWIDWTNPNAPDSRWCGLPEFWGSLPTALLLVVRRKLDKLGIPSVVQCSSYCDAVVRSVAQIDALLILLIDMFRKPCFPLLPTNNTGNYGSKRQKHCAGPCWRTNTFGNHIGNPQATTASATEPASQFHHPLRLWAIQAACYFLFAACIRILLKEILLWAKLDSGHAELTHQHSDCKIGAIYSLINHDKSWWPRVEDTTKKNMPRVSKKNCGQKVW